MCCGFMKRRDVLPLFQNIILCILSERCGEFNRNIKEHATIHKLADAKNRLNYEYVSVFSRVNVLQFGGKNLGAPRLCTPEHLGVCVCV